jgi:hypothetical protein
MCKVERKYEKHLEFIQNNIFRMNSNSFQVKGWSIAVFSGLIAISSTLDGSNESILLVSLTTATMFWFLDAYYLQQETKFRGVYDDILAQIHDGVVCNIRPYEMPLDKYKVGKYTFFTVFISKTVFPI